MTEVYLRAIARTRVDHPEFLFERELFPGDMAAINRPFEELLFEDPEAVVVITQEEFELARLTKRLWDSLSVEKQKEWFRRFRKKDEQEIYIEGGQN